MTTSDILLTNQSDLQAPPFKPRGESASIRIIPLGEHAALLFGNERDELGSIRRMLSVFCRLDSRQTDEALGAYGELHCGEKSLAALMVLSADFVDQPTTDPSALSGIAHRVYAEVEGLGRTFSVAEESRPHDAKKSPNTLHRLRFEFTDEQIQVVRAGAEFGFGIDDDRMRVAHTLKRNQRMALLADFT